MKIFIVGGTGFVGVNLANRFRVRGEEVAVMGSDARSPRRLAPGIAVIRADGRLPGAWQRLVSEATVVINLAGASIFRRWNERSKRAIVESRIQTTRNIVDALPSGGGVTLFSTSAIGYYGFHEDEELDEDAPAGGDFLSRLCVAWEAEAARAGEKGARVVITRFGIVLGPEGGVLGRMVPLFRRFLGGRLGSGRQWFSWIHIDDLFGIYLHAIGRKESAGAYNCTAPVPVTNRDLTRHLGAALHRPAVLPAPSFAVRLALGEFGDVVLKGQRVVPRRLLAEGFRFAYPRLDLALAALAPALR